MSIQNKHAIFPLIAELSVIILITVACGQAPVTASVATQTLTSGIVPTLPPISLTPTPFGGGTGKFAFLGTFNGQTDIFLMYTDGRGFINLTNDPAIEDWFRWSPDGQWIVYRTILGIYEKGRPFQNWLIRADGSDKHLLLDCPSSCGLADWASDGQNLAVKYLPSIDSQEKILILNADGSNQHVVFAADYIGDSLEWSPDGNYIAFDFLNGEENTDLAIVDRDGNFTLLTETPEQDEYLLDWSPDSTRLLFMSYDYQVGILYSIININSWSTSTISIKSDVYRWLPDGRLAGMNSNEGFLFTIVPDGSDYKFLLAMPGYTCFPSFSPDGKWVITGKSITDPQNPNIGGVQEIYLLHPGGELTILLSPSMSQGLENIKQVSWQP